MKRSELAELKPGDEVLITRSESKIYNGQTGRVVKVWDTWATIKMNDGKERPFGYGDMEKLV